MSKDTPLQEAETQELRDFISELEHIKSQYRNVAIPTYLTEDYRQEWRAILARYEHDMMQTIDKAAIELDKEEWYE